MLHVVALVIGGLFGALLSWGGLIDYNTIQDMLHLRSAYIPLMMGTAIGTAWIGIRLLKRFQAQSVVDGSMVTWEKDPPTRKTVIGAVLFGLGWSLAGTCPGPIATQIGAGRLSGLFTGGGMLLGVVVFEALRQRGSSKEGM
jgi:uncharacterized membrane protein YedE/YeeE